MTEVATAPQIRQSCKMAETFKQAGIRFVPMPVKNEEHFNELTLQMQTILTEMEGEGNEMESRQNSTKG